MSATRAQQSIPAKNGNPNKGQLLTFCRQLVLFLCITLTMIEFYSDKIKIEAASVLYLRRTQGAANMRPNLTKNGLARQTGRKELCMARLFENLLLFGEGGDGGEGASPEAAAEAANETGVTAPDAGEQKSRRLTKAERRAALEEKLKAEQQASQAPEQEKAAEEEKQTPKKDYKAIREEYKAEIGQDIQTAIQGRFKGVKDTEARLKETEQLLAQLTGDRYDIHPGNDGRLDLAAVKSAMQNDDNLFENKAAELGTSIETAKKFADMERQVAEMTAERKSREEYAAYQQVVAQAEAAKKIFPNLDLNEEMGNPNFARLIRANVPVETAYRVIHDAEITAGAMQYAAQQAKQQASASIQAGANRPTEGGLGRTAPANIQPRINDKAWREAVKRDARRGIRREF